MPTSTCEHVHSVEHVQYRPVENAKSIRDANEGGRHPYTGHILVILALSLCPCLLPPICHRLPQIRCHHRLHAYSIMFILHYTLSRICLQIQLQFSSLHRALLKRFSMFSCLNWSRVIHWYNLAVTLGCNHLVRSDTYCRVSDIPAQANPDTPIPSSASYSFFYASFAAEIFRTQTKSNIIITASALTLNAFPHQTSNPRASNGTPSNLTTILHYGTADDLLFYNRH